MVSELTSDLYCLAHERSAAIGAIILELIGMTSAILLNLALNEAAAMPSLSLVSEQTITQTNVITHPVSVCSAFGTIYFAGGLLPLFFTLSTTYFTKRALRSGWIHGSLVGNRTASSLFCELVFLSGIVCLISLFFFFATHAFALCLIDFPATAIDDLDDAIPWAMTMWVSCLCSCLIGQTIACAVRNNGIALCLSSLFGSGALGAVATPAIQALAESNHLLAQIFHYSPYAITRLIGTGPQGLIEQIEGEPIIAFTFLALQLILSLIASSLCLRSAIARSMPWS